MSTSQVCEALGWLREAKVGAGRGPATRGSQTAISPTLRWAQA